MAHERIASVFRPKRQWKPKRRDRNSKRRLKRRQWNRRNRAKLRQTRKRRYKRIKNNPLYKSWQKKKRKEKGKRKFRRGSLHTEEFNFGLPYHPETELPDTGIPDNPCAARGVPDIWFVFSEKPDTIDVDMGYVCDFNPDTEDLLIYDVDDHEFKVVNLDDFMDHAGFLEDEDWENFLTLLDRTYEQDPSLNVTQEEDMDMNLMAKRIASAHIEKMAFNKENASDLLRQLVKIMEKESKQSEGKGKKGLDDAISRVRGITKVVQNAWDDRKEE